MKTILVTAEQIAKCPYKSLSADHYREDGTCKHRRAKKPHLLRPMFGVKIGDIWWRRMLSKKRELFDEWDEAARLAVREGGIVMDVSVTGRASVCERQPDGDEDEGT